MTRLIIEAPYEFTELRVLDPLMREIAANTHTLSAHLHRGIYQVEARQPGMVDKRLIDLPASGRTQVRNLDPLLDSPAPLQGVRSYQQSHEDAARRESRNIHADLSEGYSGRLFIFLRSDGSPREQIPHLAVQAMDRNIVVQLDKQGIVHPGMGFCVLSVALPAGMYALEHKTSEFGLRRQAIFVEEGWQTQLFIPWDREGAGAERALVAMLPIDQGFDLVNEWQYHHIEAALDGLARSRMILTRKDERALLDGDSSNPILALIGAYGFARQYKNYYRCELENRTVTEWSTAIAHQLLHLLPHSPDAHLLYHLLRKLAPPPRAEPVDVPDPPVPPLTTFDTIPMFAIGTEVLFQQATPTYGIVPTDNLMATLAPRRTGGSVYTRWNPNVSAGD
ncbi:hypothetical protein [Streptomyces sp. NRRL S-378]|uniref:hypothetical protein n=1 Tax=Streptomyces sp. NRRL S-378 TaxID=1463904 RepID=UPI0004C4C958|nr:hypothetical protein [Streptomyces sp. NRRL S-378]